MYLISIDIINLPLVCIDLDAVSEREEEIFFEGYYWCGEYGNPDLPEEFEWVKTISPLHNIPCNPKTYPAILVTTADHDDRVVPGHSFKYIAQLQHQLGETMNRLGRPLIVRIDVRAGHGNPPIVVN